MCGRTACTLNPDDVSRSCRYKRKNGCKKNPKWVKNKDKYYPSHNKAPQSYSPILLNGNHFLNAGNDCPYVSGDDERVLCAMRWGLIPKWFKGGNVDKVNYSMNNARSDTMLEKKSYKIPLQKGQRCVLVVEGFYEWHTSSAGKQPYYIYFPDKDSDEPSSDPEDDQNENQPPTRLITMAGIFEKTLYENEDFYSFTVITVDADPSFSWLHHRMPAVLANDDEIDKWLDYENVPLDKALELIKPKNCLKWHPVSSFVNNSRNHGPECWKEINLDEIKTSTPTKYKQESKSMMQWLSTAKSSPSKQASVEQPSPSKAKHKVTAGAMDRFVKKAKRESHE
uniref:Abasic site processing protein HMCES n=1 Tax=Phallusia mammillata TaxID=59560 RepID=A0A6F9DF76_9ASCI|nr:embryonic stem cell-specific 5-hydroxymethylcytosine-binding protein-like [Phallusia mammillata]